MIDRIQPVIPHKRNVTKLWDTSVAAGADQSLLSVSGKRGKVVQIGLWVDGLASDARNSYINVTVDGVSNDNFTLDEGLYIADAQTGEFGLTHVTRWDDTGYNYALVWTVDIEFECSLSVIAHNADTVNATTVRAIIVYETE